MTWTDKSPTEILADIAILMAFVPEPANTLTIRYSTLKRIKRSTMSKRAYRRWRGREREYFRRMQCAAQN